MTNRQFYFSLSTGLALLALGLLVVFSGPGDWGLFWVGGIITTLAVSNRWQQRPQRLALEPAAVGEGVS